MTWSRCPEDPGAKNKSKTKKTEGNSIFQIICSLSDKKERLFLAWVILAYVSSGTNFFVFIVSFHLYNNST